MKTQKSNEKNNHLGTLYLVPTPIGNLEDMTFRAIQTLKDVDLIACEDTRVTQKLLNHFEIETQKVSYHEHNIKEQTAKLLDDLLNGKNLAQVSDAGMPSISDPGVELVEAAIAHDISVIPLPGANAALTALIASGISPQPFTFIGFLSRKKSELKQELENLKDKEETLVFYESPFRISQLIDSIVDVLGEDRKVVLAREVTKRYEEFIRGTAAEVQSWVAENEMRGEFVVILDGNKNVQTEDIWTDWTILEHVEYKMNYEKMSSKQAIKEVAKERDLPKREVYAAYHNL